MIPGTTPTHIFTLPFDVAAVAALRITYEQKEKIVLQKELKDCVSDGNTVTLKLTQAESLLFDSNVAVRIQVKVRTAAGDVLVSDVEKVPAGILLDREVI